MRQVEGRHTVHVLRNPRVLLDVTHPTSCRLRVVATKHVALARILHIPVLQCQAQRRIVEHVIWMRPLATCRGKLLIVLLIVNVLANTPICVVMEWQPRKLPSVPIKELVGSEVRQ